MSYNNRGNDGNYSDEFRDRDRNPYGRGAEAFARWAESAGIPVEEIKRQMREAMRGDFRPNSPELRRFFRQFFEGDAPNADARRANVLSLRVDDKTLAAIDSLVEVGMFATRAESAAWLLQAGVTANAELFERTNATVAEIRRLREELQRRMNTAAPGAPGTAGTSGSTTTYPKDDAPRTDADAPATPL